MERKTLKILEATPPFTMMLVTANTYTESECISETGMLESDLVGALKEIQKVISVGQGVREYKVGDLVQINFSKYAKRRLEKDSTKADMPDEYYNEVISYEIPMFEINGQTCLLIDSSNVYFRIDKYEEEVTEVAPSYPLKNTLVC